MGEFDDGLLDLGDVSTDLEALGAKDLEERGELNLDVEGESAPEYDYDSVSSPGGSTCSGPTYIRHSGFGPDVSRPLSQLSAGSPPTYPGPPSPLTHSLSQPIILTKGLASRHKLPNQPYLDNHSNNQDLRKKKKKGLLRPEFSEFGQDIRGQQISGSKLAGVKLGTLTSTRNKSRKEPLPMKLRALPQSFWQQPNLANPLPPGSVFSTLPPLPGQEGELENHAPPVSAVAGSGAEEFLRERMSTANTDLLFSLFNSVDPDLGSGRKIQMVRRGRPKKGPQQHRAGMLADDDPCLVSNMTESILPLIPERSGGKSNPQGTQVIRIMSISHGDRSVDLPSLNIEHNYPHLLSELVLKL